MKTFFFALMVAGAAIVTTDYGYQAGADRYVRTDSGFNVTRADGSTAKITKTDYGYAVTELQPSAVNTHPRRAARASGGRARH